MSAQVATPHARAAAGAMTSFRQQLFLLARSGRWAILLGSVLLVVLAVMRSGEGRESTWGRVGFALATMIGLCAPAIWALAIWYGEWPQRRSYHWALPVSRPVHDLARIAAGVPYLAGVWIVLAAALRALVIGENEISADGWITFFAAPFILYFVASPLVLWGDSPAVRWIVGFLFVWGAGVLVDFPPSYWLLAVFESSWGLEAALFGGLLRDVGLRDSSPQAMLLWLAIGVTATVFAAFWRPADLARLLRRS